MRPIALLLLAGFVWQTSAEPSTPPAPTLENGASTGAVENILSAADDVATAVAQKMGMSRELKLGFVNFRRIMLEIPQFTDMRSTLENEFRAENARLQSEQEALANMEAQLAKMERNDAYIAFEKQVIAKRRDVARQEAALRDGYSVRRNEEMAKLQSVVADEIVALAKEEGYDIILNDIGVVYVSEGADLTSAIIKRLQTRMP